MIVELVHTAMSPRSGDGSIAPRGTPRPVTAGESAPKQAPDSAGKPAEDVKSAINDAIARLTEKGSELTFQLDDESGRVIVKLIDRNTREVLRQLPSKEALAVARALSEGGHLGALVQADA